MNNGSALTRYQVSFEDRLIEPYDHGKWVKYDDVAHLEASVDERAADVAKQTFARQKQELQESAEKIALLTEAKELLEGQLAGTRHELGRVIEQQAQLIRAARDRLKLHGHTPNCASRYSKISAKGHEQVGECDCGLDDWMHETGVAHG